MKIDTIKNENAFAEIKVVFSPEDLKDIAEKLTEEAIKQVSVDGFRKGKVPRDIALSQINHLKIYEESAREALVKNYEKIIKETGIHPIGNPEILINKIVDNGEVEFLIKTSTMPHIELADYKKIAEEENKKEIKVELSKKELEQYIEVLRKMKAQEEMQKNLKEGELAKSWNEIKEEYLPELNDDFVKSLGAFKDVEDFKKKIKENLKKEKEIKEEEKKKIAILDKLIAASKIETPELFVKHELDKMLQEFEQQIMMTGISFDDYLKNINKKREDYLTEWRPQAEKRVKTQLLLHEIAKKENLLAKDEEIEPELKKIMDQYKDHKLDENGVRAYVYEVLTQQKALDFLSHLGKKEAASGEEKKNA